MISKALRILLDVSRQCARMDVTIVLVLLVFCVLVIPAIPRATANANMLSVFIDDEVPLTMGLDAMTMFPFGNPARYYAIYGQVPPIPSYFNSFIYSTYGIYGGLQFLLAFVFYAPLKWLGVEPFPLAPLLLRIVSFVGGAFSLVVLYNFAKRYAGYFAALFAAIFILTDRYFIYYSSIIHPDTLQMGLALLALALAVRHTEDKSYASLVALGFAVGLVQGTKIGGPWMIPMSVVALFWAMRRKAYKDWKAFAIDALRRFVLLGLAAVIAFFLTTPYAFLDSYYVTVWRMFSKMIIVPGTLQEISFFSWTDGLIAHHGRLLGATSLISILILAFRSFWAPPNAALVLAATLGASNILWYAAAGKLWVELGYMLVGFALSAVLIGEALCDQGRDRTDRPLLTIPLLIVQLVALVATFNSRWALAASVAAYNLSWRNATSMNVGKWASANLPHGSRIMQVHAYFNPQDFPAQQLLGLITYPDLLEFRPDYFVLSSAVYDTAWYQGLRKTQNFGREVSTGSVRLYQDLLERRADPQEMGPTGIPGISLVYRAATELGASKTCEEFANKFSFLGASNVSAVNGICMQLRLAFGYEFGVSGPELMLYKLDVRDLEQFLKSPRGKL